MGPFFRRVLGIVLGCSVSALILYFLLRKVEYEDLERSLLACDLRGLPVLAAFFFIAMLIRAFRWKYLLPNRENLSVLMLYKATLIGGLAVWLLPLRAGEFVRPGVCAKLQPVSYSASLASVFTERIFDLATLLVVLGFCVSFYDTVPELVSVGAKVLGGVAVVGIILMVFCYLVSDKIVALGRTVIGFFSQQRFPQIASFLNNLLEEFVLGVRAIGSVGHLFLVILCSFGFWVAVSMMYYVGMQMFSLPGGLLMGFTLCTMIGVAIALPSAPGFIGVFQLGCSLALTTLGGVEESITTSYSIFMHVAQVVLCFIGALIALRSEKLGFGLVLGKSKPQDSPAQ